MISPRSLTLVLATVCLATVALRAQDEAPAADTKPVIFLDKPAAIVAYQLNRLSNVQLLMVDRQPTGAKYAPVYQAILERAKMTAKDREESAEALAKIRKTDRVTELLASLEKVEGKEKPDAGVLNDLAALLVKSKPAELTARKAGLDALLGKAKQPAVREAAAAGLIIASGSADAVWAGASRDNAALAALVGGLPRVPDAKLRAQFQAKVAPLAKQAPTPALQRAAIAALPAMQGSEKANFAVLADLIKANKETLPAARAMAKLPKDSWNKDLAAPVANALVTAAGKVPQAKRTEAEFLDLASLANDLSLLLPADAGKPLRKTLGALGVRVIVIKTLHEQLFFDKTQFVVEAGKPVEIHFINTDALPHNLVLTQPGALDEIGTTAEKMQPVADKLGRLYIPDSPNIFQATKLINPEDKVKLAFTAPKAAGDYPFVCTFPGHWQRMRGVMKVVEDLEDYLVKNPNEPVAPKITEWKMDDLVPLLAKLGGGRSFQKGKELFTGVGCVACHKVGNDGLLYGPELTGVLAKYKNDPKLVLEQIMEPSKTIEPRYRTYSVEVGNDEPVSGFIVKEDADSIWLQTGPAETLVSKIAKKDIKKRDPQQLSLMPGGLLNLLNEEQILDLLAFVTSGGNPKAQAFAK